VRVRNMIAGIKTDFFELTPEILDTFKKLKASFTFALVFCYFDPAKTLCLETDASGFIIAGIIS
jgi:hypothetical protein